VTEQERDLSRPERGFSYSEAIERILALEKEVAELRARLEPQIETIARRLASGGVSFEGPPPASDLEPCPAKPPRSTNSALDTRPTGAAEWDPRRKAECPACGRVVSADSLARHRRRSHGGTRSAQDGET